MARSSGGCRERSADRLDRLEHGGVDPKDPKTKVEPNLKEYQERIKYLGMAYDALSTTYYGFFAYQRAAESFGKIADNPRFDEPRRSNAARIASMKPGAIEMRFSTTSAPSGMRAMRMRAAVASMPRRWKLSARSCLICGWWSMPTPKALAMESAVMSSCVGPMPPVVKT